MCELESESVITSRIYFGGHFVKISQLHSNYTKWLKMFPLKILILWIPSKQYTYKFTVSPHVNKLAESEWRHVWLLARNEQKCFYRSWFTELHLSAKFISPLKFVPIGCMLISLLSNRSEKWKLWISCRKWLPIFWYCLPCRNIYEPLHAFYWLLLLYSATTMLSTHARFKKSIQCQSLGFVFPRKLKKKH